MGAFEDFVNECVAGCVNATPTYRLSDDETYRTRRDDLHDAGFDDTFIEKDALVLHLLHQHGVLVSTTEWQSATVESLQQLDPCRKTAA